MKEKIDRRALRNTVAIICGKGGVGKTTLTANIGGILAAAGKKVLLVDMDPQGDLGSDLGYQGTPVDDDGHQLATALVHGIVPRPAPGVRPNLDVLVGGWELEGAQQALATDKSKSKDPRLALARVLAPLAGNYDHVLIDCPPRGEALQNAAVATARWLLVPLNGDKASRMGLAGVAGRLAEVRPLGANATLLGVILFGTEVTASQLRVRVRTRVTDAITADGLMFNAVVRRSPAVAEQVRERGLLVRELATQAEEERRTYWPRRKRGETVEDPATMSAVKVESDLEDLTVEMLERMHEREAAR